MENSKDFNELIARTYAVTNEKVLGYIAQRVNDYADAENLAQDVWLRILECRTTIDAETIENYVFAVARNLVKDYLRQIYRRRNADEEMQQLCEGTAEHSCESAVVARDLARHERIRVEQLPRQRRMIYIMSRFQERSVEDIAGEMKLSFRTVENHLRLGRRDIRDYMSAIA